MGLLGCWGRHARQMAEDDIQLDLFAPEERCFQAIKCPACLGKGIVAFQGKLGVQVAGGEHVSCKRCDGSGHFSISAGQMADPISREE